MLLSVVQPVTNSPDDLQARLEAVAAAMRELTPDSELILAGESSGGVGPAAALSVAARWIDPGRSGFGPATRAGLEAASGQYVMTLDANTIDPGEVMRDLWTNRDRGEVIVASRYVPGARVRMSLPRTIASRIVNRVFGRGLSLPVTDLSSAFRLYRSDVLRQPRKNTEIQLQKNTEIGPQKNTEEHKPQKNTEKHRQTEEEFGVLPCSSVADRSVEPCSSVAECSVDSVESVASVDYDLLPELLVRALAGGWHVHEIPLRTRLSPRSRRLIPLLRLLKAYARTFGSLWQLRNSIAAGDYDARAHDSIIPLQRYWQRQRYKHITELIAGQGPVLDVGCGSSKIIGALPPGSVALDVLANKLRYSRRYGKPLVRGSGFALPFADASFPCVLCSQVIEHVPMDSPIVSELERVLAPGGRLVLGTPDYDRWQWVYIEKAYGFFKPGGYADEHIAHYTYDGLMKHFTSRGYTHEGTRYIVKGELILAFRKPQR